MVMLVTLEQASAHLRRDTDADDSDLILKIEGASKIILNYLKDGATFLNSNGDIDEDSNGLIGVPDEVRIATLILIGILYKDRDGDSEYNKWTQGNLPFMVTSLLYPLRNPAIS